MVNREGNNLSKKRSIYPKNYISGQNKNSPRQERVFRIDTMRTPYLAAAKVKSISKSS